MMSHGGWVNGEYKVFEDYYQFDSSLLESNSITQQDWLDFFGNTDLYEVT